MPFSIFFMHLSGEKANSGVELCDTVHVPDPRISLGYQGEQILSLTDFLNHYCLWMHLARRGYHELLDELCSNRVGCIGLENCCTQRMSFVSIAQQQE